MALIRPETPADFSAIYKINRAAFDGAGEADLVDALRRAGELAVSLVSVENERTVGHIAFSPMRLEVEPREKSAYGLGPMAVMPEYQQRGIGLALVEAGLEACRQSGAEIVLVLGHPWFYPKAGFKRASHYRISCEYDVPDEVFMALELTPGALKKFSGVAYYSPLFRSVT